MKKRTPKPADVLAEMQRRQQALAEAPKFLEESFPAQRAFIEDPRRLKAALCTRRAGKSMGAAIYLLKEAWENPGAVCLYLALTRQSAKEILWGPCLKKLDQKLGLGCTFNETELTVALPNGSLIYLKGADDPGEASKFLGKAYRLVIVDEAASFRVDLTSMVHAVLQPAMMDVSGTICLIGTPSNIKRGLFFRVTTGALLPTDAVWGLHRWLASDNPHMAEKYAQELGAMDLERPLYKETPEFKQHWLGQWEIDESKLVYRFTAERNVYDTLEGEQDYRLVLGVDLGHSPDPSAFVLVGYSDTDSTLYVMEAFARTGMDFTDVAKEIRDYQSRYDIQTVVIDGANKQGVAEMSNRHGLSLVSADKREKSTFIDLMNAELIQGRVKVHVQACETLQDEWANLIWDERALQRTGKRVESAACSNHLSDACLYAWRHTYTYLATPAPTAPKPGTPAWAQEQERLMEEEQEARYRPRSEFDFPDDPFPT